MTLLSKKDLFFAFLNPILFTLILFIVFIHIQPPSYILTALIIVFSIQPFLPMISQKSLKAFFTWLSVLLTCILLQSILIYFFWNT